MNETLPALESVVRAGKAKYIGITGYDLDAIKTVAEQAQVDTILTYCRYNLHDESLLDYLPFFEVPCSFTSVLLWIGGDGNGN